MARIGEQGTRPGFSGFVVPLARFGAWRELVHGENWCIGAWRECVRALVDWCMARIGEQGMVNNWCMARFGEQGMRAWRELVHGEIWCMARIGAWRELVHGENWCMASFGGFGAWRELVHGEIW